MAGDGEQARRGTPPEIFDLFRIFFILKFKNFKGFHLSTLLPQQAKIPPRMLFLTAQKYIWVNILWGPLRFDASTNCYEREKAYLCVLEDFNALEGVKVDVDCNFPL